MKEKNGFYLNGTIVHKKTYRSDGKQPEVANKNYPSELDDLSVEIVSFVFSKYGLRLEIDVFEPLIKNDEDYDNNSYDDDINQYNVQLFISEQRAADFSIDVVSDALCSLNARLGNGCTLTKKTEQTAKSVASWY